MNQIDFEAKLKADGYTEIETQDLAPRPAKGEHGHPFAIRGLVLSGTFIVTQDSQRTVYKPGEVFAVDQGHPTTSRSVQTARACLSVANLNNRRGAVAVRKTKS